MKLEENGKQRKKLRKVYYFADLYENETGEGIVFRGQDNSKIYWAGGNKNDMRSIIKQLIMKHGEEEGKKIYQLYNQALLDIAADEVEWKFPRACLVLWRKDFEGRNDKKGI